MGTITILEPETQTPHEQWVEKHRNYLGGSDTFKLLNMAQYGQGCRTALAFEKLGIEPDFPDELDEPLLQRGKILEPLVGTLYEEKTGRKVRRPPIDENGLPIPRFHPDYPWAGVNTDRIILAGFGGVEETGDLEIKTRGEGPFLRVQRSGAFPGDLLQPHWSLFVTNHAWGALATLGVFGSLPLVHFDIKRDEEIIDVFKREGDDFANTVWGKGLLPAPTIDKDDQRCKVCQWRMSCRGEAIDKAEAAALREVRKSKKNLVQITNNELALTLAEIDIVKAEQKNLTKLLDGEEGKEGLLGRAMKLLDGSKAEAALVRGYGKVYKLESQAHYLDATRLKDEQPEIYAEYYVSKKTGNHYLRQYPEKIGA